jgi:hypothetical protein
MIPACPSEVDAINHFSCQKTTLANLFQRTVTKKVLDRSPT